MIYFRLKTFNAAGKAAMSTGDKIMKYVVPSASLGLSATGVMLSSTRNKQLREQNKQQLKAMNKLSESLGKVDRSLENSSRSFERYSESIKKGDYSAPLYKAAAEEPKKKKGFFNIF